MTKVEPIAPAQEHRLRPTAAATIGGVLRTARPKQWLKNVLVFAAPFTAGRIGDLTVLRSALIAFVVFCLAASAIYFVNDAKDVDADRAHPAKRNRPIAAGLIPVPVAFGVGIVLLLAALGVAAAQNWQLVVVIAVYEGVQLGYCFGLKHEPVIDLCIVASGFLLRSISGGVAANIPLSQWFLLTTAFGSLFMVSGKRYAEIRLFNQTGAEIRSSLRKYSASYLRFVWATAVAVVIATYCQWAFQLREQFGTTWSEISIVPFVIALLRYAIDVDGGKAGSPEEIVLHDRLLQVLGVAWITTLALAFYF
ncbi:decaprenyl-phosphate phosphoribosyltransferase [Amycolatopsis sp. SID8362]|uniref:decaprenyl-phosphate phosphoribosyltransferase n=1 Tax=Amycolatopsis sp. SID8362 TaxID=2690346 RepID=UPI00136D0826|nr:decaprenyl-phosphate phosphoribosyltransferase [Amycolatopsis sp. SID8362]NBH11798.1 decaprenyl-phosphate phosphoribosyltransferase [Amycolatopsis sp. SID8362]NED48490.1 decaprenyl-phosphate phosphoribosyltransferase [Amycolatopsis sp. SID8362]